MIQQSFAEHQFGPSSHAGSWVIRIKPDQILFLRHSLISKGEGNNYFYTAQQALWEHQSTSGAPLGGVGVRREVCQEEVTFEPHRLSRS